VGVGVCASEREAAPGFSLYDSEGAKRELSEYQGKVVLLNFWATWCAPCRTEIPWLNDIQKEYSREGFTVVGVAMDERGWRAVTPFLAEYDVDYPVLLGNAKVARLYGGLETLPKTLFLDRKGRIVAVHEAILSKAHLRKIVALLLAEKD
jgi:thiol-disulfide isomerase/thioredoxin